MGNLPRISMIIPFLHESWQHIKPTVGSIIVNTPEVLLEEVIFIDDGNDNGWSFHDELRALHPKVKVHRNDNRLGLIQSKIVGADISTGEVLMFMEPHCVVAKKVAALAPADADSWQ